MYNQKKINSWGTEGWWQLSQWEITTSHPVYRCKRVLRSKLRQLKRRCVKTQQYQHKYICFRFPQLVTKRTYICLWRYYMLTKGKHIGISRLGGYRIWADTNTKKHYHSLQGEWETRVQVPLTVVQWSYRHTFIYIPGFQLNNWSGVYLATGRTLTLVSSKN